MSLEAKFRRHLEHTLRPHVDLFAYMSSMNRAGVPDVYILDHGRSLWAELKAIDSLPRSQDANVLTRHKFTGPQVSFLRKVARAQGLAMGLVGLSEPRGQWRIVKIAIADMGDDGSLAKSKFLASPVVLTADDLFTNRA